MTLRKSKRFPVRNGSLESLLEITPVFTNPSDFLQEDMTEVLSSQHSPGTTRDVELFPRQQPAAVDGNSEENACSSFAVASPVVMPPRLGFGRNSNNGQHILQQEVNGGMAQSCRSDIELSLLTFVFEALRRSGLSCQGSVNQIQLDIGRPTNVRHVAHVTFDRFNGFLGLPAEFQLEVPRRVPSASVSAFGVSAESMQCSYDRKGNSVPTILLLLQERLYDQGGLKAEGIFRINAENSQEEHVRSQLNSGIVPYGIDVHCLAGLIKAWFRELPRGVLDSLSPEQVMQCHTEEQAVALVKTLPPTQAALLDWGINLMADVVQEENCNKMNAHNIAMVFAPNMTQMSDPLTALMHAVQVMNLLKMLILRTLRDREEVLLEPRSTSSCNDPPNGSGRDNAATMSFLRNKMGTDKHTLDGRRVFLRRSHHTGDNIDDNKFLRGQSNGNGEDNVSTWRIPPNKAGHASDGRQAFFRSFLAGDKMNDHEPSRRPSNRNGQDNVAISKTRPNKAGHEPPAIDNRQVFLRSHHVGDNIGNYRNASRPFNIATIRPLSNKTATDNHHGNDERHVFRSFLVRDSVDNCESAHNPEDTYSRRMQSKYEHDLSSERQRSSSNASSSLDDDSRCSSPKLFSRAGSWNVDTVNGCVKHSQRCKSEFSNVVGNMDRLTMKSENVDIAEIVQCGELGPVSGATKRKGNVDKVDKFIGRVEAW